MFPQLRPDLAELLQSYLASWWNCAWVLRYVSAALTMPRAQGRPLHLLPGPPPRLSQNFSPRVWAGSLHLTHPLLASGRKTLVHIIRQYLYFHSHIIYLLFLLFCLAGWPSLFAQWASHLQCSLTSGSTPTTSCSRSSSALEDMMRCSSMCHPLTWGDITWTVPY